MKFFVRLMLEVLLLGGSFAAAAAWDTYSDTWVATDGLGRALPTLDEVGPPKTNQWRVIVPVATNGSRFFRLQAP